LKLLTAAFTEILQAPTKEIKRPLSTNMQNY